MADKIKFLYGSTADIQNLGGVPGQVYFAVDSLTSNATNGKLYFDVPIGNGNYTRVLMSNRVDFAATASTANYASTAELAKADASGHNIQSFYLSTHVAYENGVLKFYNGNNSESSSFTIAGTDEKLKVKSLSTPNSKIYLLGNSSSGLGTANTTVTTTAVTSPDIYIDTDGYLKGKVQVKPLHFQNSLITYNGSNETYVGNTVHYLKGTATSGTVNNSFVTATASSANPKVFSSKWGAIDLNNAIGDYLYDGMTIAYKVPVAANSSYGAAIKISKNDGTVITLPSSTATYYPVVYSASSQIGTRYPVNSVMLLVFDADQTANYYDTSSTAIPVTGCWKLVDYDNNTFNYTEARYGQAGWKANSNLYRYQLVAQVDNEKLTPFNSAADNSWSSTTKTMLTSVEFNPFGHFLYYATTSSVTTGGNIAANQLYHQKAFDLRYSFNISTASGATNQLVARKAVYLKTSLPNANGLVTLASNYPLEQTLPSADTDNLYIYLGQAYSTYQIELSHVHPVYAHLDGHLQEISGQSLYSRQAVSAKTDENGHNFQGFYLSTHVAYSNNTLKFYNGNNTESSSFTIVGTDEKLKVTSTSGVSSKIYLIGNNNSTLGTNNKSVTSTGITYTNVYIDTTGKINATVTTAVQASTATKALYDDFEDPSNVSSKTISSKYIASISLSTGSVPIITAKSGANSDVFSVPWLNIDSNTGIIDIAHIPQAALERFIGTYDSLAIAISTLTASNTTVHAQVGDMIKAGGSMYVIKNSDLTSTSSYEEFAVGKAGSVDWSNILDKPSNILGSNSSLEYTRNNSKAEFTIKWYNYTGSLLSSAIYTIPGADTSSAGLVTTGEQSFAGKKTFTSSAVFSKQLNYSGISTASTSTQRYGYIWFSSTGTKGVPLYSTSLVYDAVNNQIDATAKYAVYDNGAGTSVPINNKYVASATLSTENLLTLKSGANSDIASLQILNYYPSSFTWTQTSSSVTGSLSNRSSHSTAAVNTVSFDSIPLATATGAGIVTSSAQTFGGVKTFNDGIEIGNSGKLSMSSQADSTYSRDVVAAFVIQGGASIGKQLSAKTVRIDDNFDDKGCTLTFNSTSEVLSFVFQ